MESMSEELRELAARAGRGDCAAKEEFLDEIVPLILRVVRREIRRGSDGAASPQPFPAEAGSGFRHSHYVITDDHDMLLLDVTRRVCEVAIGFMLVPVVKSAELKKTVRHRAPNTFWVPQTKPMGR